MGEIEVRQADLSRSEDADAVLSLVDAYARDPMGRGMPLDFRAREVLVPALDAVPDRLVLLAFVGSEAVGVAVCFQGFSTFNAKPLINIHDLAVLPQWRGLGIGRALIGAAEAEARHRGCCKLTLEVREDNRIAAALYRKQGFGAGRSGEASAQYLFMEKRFPVEDG